MCQTCGQRLPYRSRRRYCSRRCWRQRPRASKILSQYSPEDIVRLLNSGRPVECVAAELACSRAQLYRLMRVARIVRVGGAPHRPGQYAVAHWRNARQLSLF